MKKTTNKNFIASSNLVLISAGLGLINFFLMRSELVTTQDIAIAIITLIFISGLGYIIRKGYNWIKYLLLVLTALGVIESIGLIIVNLAKQPVITSINVIQTALQVWAVVLLFSIPKQTNSKPSL